MSRVNFLSFSEPGFREWQANSTAWMSQPSCSCSLSQLRNVRSLHSLAESAALRKTASSVSLLKVARKQELFLDAVLASCQAKQATP